MHHIQRLVQLAVLAMSLSSCAAGSPVCAPNSGDSAEQLQRQCGTPQEVHRAGVMEEWRYGDVYVGLLDGFVAYVLE